MSAERSGLQSIGLPPSFSPTFLFILSLPPIKAIDLFFRIPRRCLFTAVQCRIFNITGARRLSTLSQTFVPLKL